MRADFFVDCRPGAGLGHLRRCLVLARALRERGVDVELLLTDVAGAAHARAAGFPVRVVASATGARPDAELVVVDGYQLTVDGPAEVPGRTVVQFNDVGERPVFGDVIVNANVYGADLDYGSATVLAGQAYSLADPRFFATRGAPRSPRVLVSFGGTDDGSFGLPVALAIRDRLPDLPITVIVTPAGEPPVTPAAGVEVVSDVAMVDEMRRSTAYVGAAGQTVYEALAAGLAVVTCPIVENQQLQAGALRARGICVVDRYDPPVLAARLLDLLRCPSAPTLDEIDGAGAGRLAGRLLEIAHGREV